MAVKKKCRKSRKSFGIHGHPKRARVSTGVKRLNNQIDAWLAGKRVMLTIPNPDKGATNERFIRVESRNVWGLPPCERKRGVNAG